MNIRLRHHFQPITSSPTEPEADADVVVGTMSGSGVVVEGNVVVGRVVVGMVVGLGVDGLIVCGVPTVVVVVGLGICSAKGNAVFNVVIKTCIRIIKRLNESQCCVSRFCKLIYCFNINQLTVFTDIRKVFRH